MCLVEVPSSTPAPEFDFNEVGDHYILFSPRVDAALQPPSPASSVHLCAVEVSPRGSSRVTSQFPKACPEEPLDAPSSSKGISMLERWFQLRFKKTNKNQAEQFSAKSARPANSQSQPTVNTANDGPSWMAATQRVKRAVAKPVVKKPVK
ncbi:hypothetical protein J3R83DRAFT_13227 [Lanmaoa asiatica]|nr:hypothetical protein J3R83DRAFT_13227 [Lanmaoa asiatica]